MPPRTLVIGNPRSRGGGAGRRWPALERSLRDALEGAEVERTRGPRDAERIAREAVRAGIERLIVMGGDGTLSEVVNGLLAAGLGAYAQIGLLPLGTGADFARSLGVSHRFDAALAGLATAKPRSVDAARISFLDASGRERVRYAVNAVSAGVSGLVVELVGRSRRRLGGRVAFLLGTLRAVLRYRAQRVEIRVDGERFFEGPLLVAVAANGRCFGGGMQVAPGARLDDGLLDVVAVGGLPLVRLLPKIPGIYRGSHIGDAATHFRRGRVVEARGTSGSVAIEADGEPLGVLPARVEVLPGALTFLGPPE